MELLLELGPDSGSMRGGLALAYCVEQAFPPQGCTDLDGSLVTGLGTTDTAAKPIA